MSRGVAETAAEQFYMGVKRAVVAVIIVAPDLGYQLLPAQRDVDVPRKIKEQILFLRRHIDPPALNVNKSSAEIDRKIAVIDDIVFVFVSVSASA